MTNSTPVYTRATSIYTIRLTVVADRAHRREILAAIAAHLPAVLDHGDNSVSFRAAGDASAILIARAAAAAADDWWFCAELTTGLGIHRRTVTA